MTACPDREKLYPIHAKEGNSPPSSNQGLSTAKQWYFYWFDFFFLGGGQ